MDVKEKLVELLLAAPFKTVEEHANHLIANGVVPVVRCEECVHCYQLIVDGNGFWQEVENGGTHNLCRRNESTFDIRCDDFCSYGERKDNDF